MNKLGPSNTLSEKDNKEFLKLEQYWI